MSKTDEEMARFERLPKWAQDKIKNLKRDLEHATAKLREGPEDSNTFSHPYSDLHRKPLGRDTSVGFYLDNDENDRLYFKVCLTTDHERNQVLEIYGSHGYQIIPRSSNSILIKLNERF